MIKPSSRSFLILTALALVTAGQGADSIHIKAITGLHYDITQFAAKPGESVTVVLENADTTDMPHNLVFTKPGKREAVVSAALALGADGPRLGYVPESPDVLWSIPVVMANEKKTLTFTAPKEPGIYPYVCCFPGHGLLMFGAMYVGVTMPAPVPSQDGEGGAGTSATMVDGKSPHAYPLQRPMMYRMFMPGASPAAIAVALPGQDSLCWDAGQCRFRYAWSGGFVDNQSYWKGNGNGQAKLLGPIWYTAGKGQPLRLKRDVDPVTAFKGYQLVKGLPEFQYTADGIEVHELITAGEKPHSMVFSYQVMTDQAVFIHIDPQPAVLWSSNVGAFDQGILSIPAKQGRSFRLTLAGTAGGTP